MFDILFWRGGRGGGGKTLFYKGGNRKMWRVRPPKKLWSIFSKCYLLGFGKRMEKKEKRIALLQFHLFCLNLIKILFTNLIWQQKKLKFVKCERTYHFLLCIVMHSTTFYFCSIALIYKKKWKFPNHISNKISTLDCF